MNDNDLVRVGTTLKYRKGWQA